MEFNTSETVFPVIGIENNEIKNLFGTAFSIGNDYFLTAGHVLNGIKQHEKFTLGFQNLGIYDFVQIEESELFENIDIGIIKCESTFQLKPYKWSLKNCPSLTKVISLGFPHGYDSKHNEINSTCFDGYISARLLHFRTFTGDPSVYQLSFQVPRDLSGAPLFLNKGSDDLVVNGIIVGNNTVEIPVFASREVVNDGTKEIFYEKSEAMHSGIAITAEVISKQASHLLEMNIGDYLYANGLVIDL